MIRVARDVPSKLTVRLWRGRLIIATVALINLHYRREKLCEKQDCRGGFDGRIPHSANGVHTGNWAWSRLGPKWHQSRLRHPLLDEQVR